MELNLLQVLLILLVTFVAAIDQFSFLQSFYRPIVIGPIIGAILGDLNTGLIIGASYELMMIGSMPVGGAQPPNVVIGGIMATVFAISMGLADPQAALGISIPFALLGQYAVILTFTVMATLMSKADAMAAKANTTGIEYLNYFAMGALGLLFAAIVFLGLIFGQAIGATLTEVLPLWVWTGLGAAGGMMRFVGFAVLMKVMLSRDYWGFYFAGFALASITDTILGGAALLVIAIIGTAIAIYDFQMNVKIKALGLSSKGGDSDGI